MALRKVWRRVLIGLGFFVAIVVFLWVSMPVWFPWVLRPVAGRFGATYSRYERQGYEGFVLHDVAYVQGSTVLKAKRVEALVPAVWLWRARVAKKTGPEPFVQATGWEYRPSRSAKESNSPTPVGPEFTKLVRQLRGLNRWVPVVALTNGTVDLEPDHVTLPGVIWSDGSISGTVQPSADLPLFSVQALLDKAGGCEAKIAAGALDLSSRIRAFTNSAGLAVESVSSWWSNRVEVRAQFGMAGSLPLNATLSVKQAHLPPEAFGVHAYREIQGSVLASWHAGALSLDLDAQAEPQSSTTNFPPLKLALHARGDTNAAIIETATLVSPALTAQLSRELRLYFSGELLRQPAFLKLTGDLSQQAWIQAQGKIDGEVDFSPSGGKYPRANFRLSAANPSYRSIQGKSFKLEGKLDWPWLDISRADATMEDGSTLSLQGRLDVETKDLPGANFRFAGAFPKRWLPAGFDYRDLEVSGNLSGPLSAVRHSGHVLATEVRSPLLRPVQLDANWSGEQTSPLEFKSTLSSGSSSLLVQGKWVTATNHTEVDLTKLTLLTNTEPVLALAAPCFLQATRSATSTNHQIKVSPSIWQGSGGRLEAEGALAWPQEGKYKVHVSEFSSGLLTSFFQHEPPVLRVNKLDVAGGWTNGPMEFTLSLEVAAIAAGGEFRMPVHLAFEGSGDRSGLVVSNLVVTAQTSSIVSVRGSIPLSFQPGEGTNALKLDPDKPLRLTAVSPPAAMFWDEVARYTGVLLREPQLRAEVSGTCAAPEGRVTVQVGQIQPMRARKALPELTHLELVLELGKERARLTSGQVLVQGQRVSLTGEMPLGDNFWRRLEQKQTPDWQQARARLQVEDAELAAFGQLFPKFIAPQGQWNADVLLLPGLKFAGGVSIEHARTRPLGNIGPVRDIDIDLRFRGRGIELAGATARISGSTLTLSGQADLSGTEWLAGELPPFTLALHGTDLPLAREPELVLRSDLLLAVTKTNGAPPLVSGRANLRDSFYLSDIRELVPGKVATPSRRPPYFSVEDPELADWRLAVDVTGTKFMKVRSTLFNGEVSTTLKLNGTLKDPIALGEVKIDSGLVRFPFASLPVKYGLVTLTSQDPYRPELAVRAASKQFGYDIRMDVTGPVDAPIVQFNSTPPLSSDQILLMVTAGELPQGTFSLSPQQRAQTVALFFGRDALAKLGIGDQTEQRLTIKTGEEISEQGRPTYQVEFQMTDRWSLTGEYDRFGAYNAGVKWRVYSK